jgi:Ca-activated chloride channel homolog
MLTWNTSNRVILDSHPVSGPNDPTLRQAAQSLDASGGTDLNGGLVAGYQIAQKNFAANQLNRLILISDGQANVGITEEQLIARNSLMNDGDGVYLTGVGVGDGVNDTLMNVVTDKGRGAYVYLDSELEARKIFVDRFDEVLDVAARAVRVELRLPWYMGISQFFGEEFSRDPRMIEPQHLAPNDAMVFSQILSGCSPELVKETDPVEIVAHWQVPITVQNREVRLQTSFEALRAQSQPALAKAFAIVAYAEALKRQPQPSELESALVKLNAANPSGSDSALNEIKILIEKARGLVR